ncbi:hypothetical protein QBC46DRAFT_361615 [Diplogelasinospora grovesii]|uniref:MOSC domain-containing protein n=1 Tax=Diplogelasinospora grovesii TaxID=303347 RepID=A0AAN6NEZ5_9PEZI|nr:hypothetical protein QBC46DRAFT_361615 [Diplogelasinospora grovesii]
MPAAAAGGGSAGGGIDGAGIFLVFITICVFLLPIFLIFPPVAPSQSDAISQTHKKVGLRRTGEKSGLKDNGRKKAGIKGLWIYPVKSCKGIEVSESRVLPSGLEFDRLFTFAQLRGAFPVSVSSSSSSLDNTSGGGEGEKGGKHSWEFVTQRQFPLLATVSVDLYIPDTTTKPTTTTTTTKVTLNDVDNIKRGGHDDVWIILRFPWRGDGLRGVWEWVSAKLRGGRHAVPEKEVLLPVAFPTEGGREEKGYQYESVKIWREQVLALNMSAEIPRELSLYLGVSNRLGLFRIDPARLREVYRCAPDQKEVGYQPVTGFQDAYPLHMLNLSSVRDFETKIQGDDQMKELDPRRFRANIIIDGVEAYDEESWKRVQFKGDTDTQSVFDVSCRTVRCKMPNVDQDSGSRHPVEPDRALRKFRDVDEGAKGKGCLGMQLTPLFDNAGSLGKKGGEEEEGEELEAWVEVGMEVEVLKRGEHRYIVQ